MGLAQLLALALQGIAEYRTARDKALAAGEVTADDGTVMSNAELIGLFKMDATVMRDHAAQLLEKYGATPPSPAP